MATIKEIAKKCNVSIATVSNILNGKPNASEETRAKVMKVVKEMNYHPNYVAKNLKMKSTHTIGVIVEDITVFCAPMIIDGITAYCEEKDYHVLLTNLRLYQKYEDAYYKDDRFHDLVQQEIMELLSKQVDGIIYVTSHERVVKCLPDNLNIPAVMAYGYTESKQFPSIVVDDIHGAYAIVDHMIQMGHKEIGVICGKEDSLHCKDRLKGYQKALYDNTLFYNPELIASGDWTREGGYQAVDHLLEKGVSAIFCMNDLMAGGAYDRLAEKGLKVGQDISIGGFDNREVSSYYNPPLTTVELPLFDIGKCACKTVMELIERGKKDHQTKEIELNSKEETQGNIKENIKANRKAPASFLEKDIKTDVAEKSCLSQMESQGNYMVIEKACRVLNRQSISQ